jgi:hypothetical protein
MSKKKPFTIAIPLNPAKLLKIPPIRCILKSILCFIHPAMGEAFLYRTFWLLRSWGTVIHTPVFGRLNLRRGAAWG